MDSQSVAGSMGQGGSLEASAEASVAFQATAVARRADSVVTVVALLAGRLEAAAAAAAIPEAVIPESRSTAVDEDIRSAEDHPLHLHQMEARQLERRKHHRDR